MANWQDTFEDFKEEFFKFVERKYNNFDLNEMEEAYEHWVDIEELASVLLEELALRTEELDGDYGNE